VHTLLSFFLDFLSFSLAWNGVLRSLFSIPVAFTVPGLGKKAAYRFTYFFVFYIYMDVREMYNAHIHQV